MSFEYLNSVRKIVCIGRNYAEHIKELNNTVPKRPFYFLKPTSSIITPCGRKSAKKLNGATFQGLNEDGTNPSPIYVPANVQVHHEIELALVIGKYISNVDPRKYTMNDLLNSVTGVALALDLTGRNVQNDAKAKGLPWTLAKGYDTFCPISEMIPISRLDRLENCFQLKCFVNGELRQDGSTSLMLNSLPKIVSSIAQSITLEPGDLVLTGTPAGVGELKTGDTISGELHYNNARIVEMAFDVENRPGTYEY
ncbi:hypothetical protein KAFR_0A07450 [Kazachstania africana CBS 2517]|uniref:Fumarylacetoacetase-like C-terminal domain-containing protein n=1 Tax=Kazachstania africana (strain ATCC 22294 / BCRC 22015 / CBS 2517 / CECT 1963 / NBRC 1671 / NRRL Y-8276) TaxID=1071382 RepID=H2AP79_KAZAF|nr:hypothetical protein KAFR_0A07450 [Kazachstania africana CBS 2517]CCF56179.1 hypothetical protein KAFR_0A07450 [Kazachstania africana CBS 2517]